MGFIFLVLSLYAVALLAFLIGEVLFAKFFLFLALLGLLIVVAVFVYFVFLEDIFDEIRRIAINGCGYGERLADDFEDDGECE